jgi:hypothetical protein
MSPEADRARALAHDRALADWLEAEGLVASLRRSAAAAAERAAGRARAARALLRTGRCDPFAIGASDAAQVLAQRAAAEAQRLAEALRAEATLRARVVAARSALAAANATSSSSDRGALRCG